MWIQINIHDGQAQSSEGPAAGVVSSRTIASPAMESAPGPSATAPPAHDAGAAPAPPAPLPPAGDAPAATASKGANDGGRAPSGPPGNVAAVPAARGDIIIVDAGAAPSLFGAGQPPETPPDTPQGGPSEDGGELYDPGFERLRDDPAKRLEFFHIQRGTDAGGAPPAPGR